MADLNLFNKHFQQELTCEKQHILLKSTRIIFTKQKCPKRSVAITITGYVEFTGSEYVQVRTRQFLDDLKIMCSVISTLFNKEQKIAVKLSQQLRNPECTAERIFQSQSPTVCCHAENKNVFIFWVYLNHFKFSWSSI